MIKLAAVIYMGITWDLQGAGSSYASAALLDRLRIQPHQREVRQIEMMLGAVTKTVEIFKVQVSSTKGEFSLVTEITKVDWTSASCSF